jgi:pectinesterase inhibitor-like protein
MRDFHCVLQQEHRQERGEMRRLEVLAWSCAIATVVLALAPGVAAASEATHDVDDVSLAVSRIGTAAPSPTSNVTAICLSTPYPSACETALSSPAQGSSGTDDPFATSVHYAMARVASARAVARNLSAAHLRGARPPPGVQDCAELLDISLDQLGDALAAAARDADGVTTWLSAALTNQATCDDSLAADPDTAGRGAVRARLSALTQFIATALALHVNKSKAHHSGGGSPSSGSLPTPASPFPSWVTQQDRKLLESSHAGASGGLAVDAVVALDGSGTHRTINEAIAAVTTTAANGGGARKVIHVKAGRYEESVTVSSKQKNVMLMGDGKGKSVIVGHKSAGEGYTTYASATVGTTSLMRYTSASSYSSFHHPAACMHKSYIPIAQSWNLFPCG